MVAASRRWASTSSCRPGTTSPASCRTARSACKARSASATRPWWRDPAASPWARAMARVERPHPAAPVTATSWPLHPGGADAAPGRGRPLHRLDRGGGRGQRGQQVGPVEGIGEHGGRPHRSPIGSPAPVVDHDHGRPGLASPIDQVAIEGAQATVDEHGRVGLAGFEASGQLFGGHALDELDGHRGVGRPAAQVAEPGGSGLGQTRHPVPAGAHRRRLWGELPDDQCLPRVDPMCPPRRSPSCVPPGPAAAGPSDVGATVENRYAVTQCDIRHLESAKPGIAARGGQGRAFSRWPRWWPGRCSCPAATRPGPNPNRRSGPGSPLPPGWRGWRPEPGRRWPGPR